ncbi:rhamnan synthesis F family protein [Streptococcus entericus]|uniref:rhamnan synthesis F family protein n=1 Tax=Streptococcus entericus TaxID=155680 RepID=UPI00035E5AB4|nr:rhamnan synthesis F family protein [Streptococcus entericus]
MNRLLLYVHYNKYNQLSSHVLFQLEKMRPLFSKVIFISNSQLSSEHGCHLLTQGLVSEIVQRENEGFDFVAWRDGMEHLGWQELTTYDSVTIMNDTCFGPLWDISTYYERYESDQTTDFWGMTNHRETKRFKEHLQSYFICFKQQVVQSPVFKEFWTKVKSYDIVQDVIDYLESPVTNNFVDAGFQYQAVFDTTKAETHHMPLPDFSYYNLAQILEHRVPFIKVKALDGNQQQASFVIDRIATISDYPIELIVSHMSRVFYPTSNYLLRYKYMTDSPVVIEPSKKIAIHLHAFYTDLVGDFLEIFKTFSFIFDLFITTNEESKRIDIEEVLTRFGMTATIKVTGNRGRDILPMLKLKDELSQYDYIGHFHTKKSKETEYWAGESWRTELIEMLVKPSDQIVSQFSRREDLGVVIADIPTYFRYVQLDPFYEGILTEDMNRLWEQMGMKKELDFLIFSTFVMSYGTYIWFKYDALKPLFDLELTDNDVPEEPLPSATILHSIERMLVYIAWGNDYDFLISKNPISLPPFVDVNLLNTREGAKFNPLATVDFTYFGGIKGAIKYTIFINLSITKYLVKRLLRRR